MNKEIRKENLEKIFKKAIVLQEILKSPNNKEGDTISINKLREDLSKISPDKSEFKIQIKDIEPLTIEIKIHTNDTSFVEVLYSKDSMMDFLKSGNTDANNIAKRTPTHTGMNRYILKIIKEKCVESGKLIDLAKLQCLDELLILINEAEYMYFLQYEERPNNDIESWSVIEFRLTFNPLQGSDLSVIDVKNILEKTIQ